MVNKILVAVVAFVAISSDANAQFRTHQRRGAILGGLAGAAIGAAIGDKGDNEVAGALIGGAVGAVAGGSIGNEKDHRIEHHQRYHSQQYYPPPTRHHVDPAPPQTHYVHPHPAPQPIWRDQPVPQAQPPIRNYPAGPVSPLDVVSMVRHGVPDSTIIRFVQSYGVTQPLSVRDIITLHEQGVSETVISVMQTVPVGHGQIAQPYTETVVPQSTKSYRPMINEAVGEETIYGPSILNSDFAQPELRPAR
ncbi:Glycine zipper 2TM domain protein [Planctomycetes bacterium CA13]|uniref:Glycine zipper 2TM domain protein n=1 Tax=Novipirellula herctigrandis TaxID=2527986 RepID=A0A5C5YP75_9BACT|nr:Glycine zipper 2TM domain protein [Planctomycetes bacterium CA13]